jgi:hypothetical protein
MTSTLLEILYAALWCVLGLAGAVAVVWADKMRREFTKDGITKPNKGTNEHQ